MDRELVETRTFSSGVVPPLLAMPGVALALIVVLAVHAPSVRWNSGAGIPLLALVAGLLRTAVAGRWYAERH
ncbi:hypothetical protein OG389_35475 [Streptomyces sp. NBC_00435]|uniref:hypothetical protein n=1 Tax=Streptomyces sp. NBC_00435 TaxID=2903649 RepID=UPI002E201B08